MYNGENQQKLIKNREDVGKDDEKYLWSKNSNKLVSGNCR